MNHNFAEIVEEVKHLSIDEKKELQELIERYMIDEKRREIHLNYLTSLEELADNKITFSSDPNNLRELLSQ